MGRKMADELPSRQMQSHALHTLLLYESGSNKTRKSFICIVSNSFRKLLFTAVNRWSEEVCAKQYLPVSPQNKRHVLGEALYSSSELSPEEFADTPFDSGLIKEEVTAKILANCHRTVKLETPFALRKRVASCFQPFR